VILINSIFRQQHVHNTLNVVENRNNSIEYTMKKMVCLLQFFLTKDKSW